jgi:hypothetical protein
MTDDQYDGFKWLAQWCNRLFDGPIRCDFHVTGITCRRNVTWSFWEVQVTYGGSLHEVITVGDLPHWVVLEINFPERLAPNRFTSDERRFRPH